MWLSQQEIEEIEARRMKLLKKEKSKLPINAKYEKPTKPIKTYKDYLKQAVKSGQIDKEEAKESYKLHKG